MEHICPECNIEMRKMVSNTHYCDKCKITFTYILLNNKIVGDLYINDPEPLDYTVAPLVTNKSFTECCRFYKLKAFS